MMAALPTASGITPALMLGVHPLPAAFRQIFPMGLPAVVEVLPPPQRLDLPPWEGWRRCITSIPAAIGLPTLTLVVAPCCLDPLPA